MAYKNIELRRQRGRERYYRQREQRLQYAHDKYYSNLDASRAKNRANVQKVRQKKKAENLEAFMEQEKTRARKQYKANSKRIIARYMEYYNTHRDEIHEKYLIAKAERKNAKKICPAFRFIMALRTEQIGVYLTKYKPHSNLGHLAAKNGCQAIKRGDWSQCPINIRAVTVPNTMARACKMPHVFELPNATEEIKKFAKAIAFEHNR